MKKFCEELVMMNTFSTFNHCILGKSFHSALNHYLIEALYKSECASSDNTMSVNHFAL